MCRLVNSPTATSCDCGYSFADGSMGQPLQVPGIPVRLTDDAKQVGLAERRLRIAVLRIAVAVTGLVILTLVKTCAYR